VTEQQPANGNLAPIAGAMQEREPRGPEHADETGTAWTAGSTRPSMPSSAARPTSNETPRLRRSSTTD
jgi:hypothetical protein